VENLDEPKTLKSRESFWFDKYRYFDDDICAGVQLRCGDAGGYLASETNKSTLVQIYLYEQFCFGDRFCASENRVSTQHCNIRLS
jgi:hypothetical protein